MGFHPRTSGRPRPLGHLVKPKAKIKERPKCTKGDAGLPEGLPRDAVPLSLLVCTTAYRTGFSQAPTPSSPLAKG